MPTRTDALASVYARSLYELAEQAGGQDKIAEVAAELEDICELARSDRRLREFFASPIIDRAARRETLRRIFANRITDLVLRFLLVLNANGRLGHLEPICAALDQLVQETFGRVEVDVFTTAPLESEQLNALVQRVRDAISREPVLHPYTDPSMMGGIKLRIGDQLIDGSVAGKLKRMRQKLQQSSGYRMREQKKDFFTTE